MSESQLSHIGFKPKGGAHERLRSWPRNNLGSQLIYYGIQQRLGHASAATTSIYLQALRADENLYAEDLVRVLGVEG